MLDIPQVIYSATQTDCLDQPKHKFQGSRGSPFKGCERGRISSPLAYPPSRFGNGIDAAIDIVSAGTRIPNDISVIGKQRNDDQYGNDG